jgi:hypothetical protein
MPGIEKRLARYPLFYSRIGFVHEFRPLAAAETRQLLERGWVPPGVNLPKQPWEPETVATIIRMTGGNFRLLNRLLAQMERILEINALQELTKAVVEAARESLVIGEPESSRGVPATSELCYRRRHRFSLAGGLPGRIIGYDEKCRSGIRT